jgi:hypothetical protein
MLKPGQLSVGVTGDADPENEDQFLMTLQNPINAAISRGQAMGKIYNDDCATRLSAGTYVGVTIGCINKLYRIEASYDGASTWTALTNLRKVLIEFPP